jgi:hypothetical protein
MASTNSSAGSTGAHGANQSTASSQQSGLDPNQETDALSNYILFICASVSAALIIWRLVNVLSRYLRTITSLNNETQRYFITESQNLSFFKRNLLYAPIFRKRHNREFQLSTAINVGTLPTRVQLIFLVGYLATNVAFCVVDIPFAGSFNAAAGILRNRTGSLAIVNMVCPICRLPLHRF